jgi:hypothetical protein
MPHDTNLLPLASEPFTPPTDRDMSPSERREFVRTHRTCVFGTTRKVDGPAMSVVYYIPGAVSCSSRRCATGGKPG